MTAQGPVPPPAVPVRRRIATELGVREAQVTAAIEQLDGGATVPFIARYRKEVTGALDDEQLRTLQERLRYCGNWTSGGPPSWNRRLGLTR